MIYPNILGKNIFLNKICHFNLTKVPGKKIIQKKIVQIFSSLSKKKKYTSPVIDLESSIQFLFLCTILATLSYHYFFV